ncbi:MAG: tetratricopeptide repeat protein [Chloroflexi bacterium]|nr:tetratricopeptide repeat protein [Chloroflexota bacterium]
MAQPVNPYVGRLPAQGGKGFFGRQEILYWVARSLDNPATNSLVLFGQRRIGKTTLLLQLERTLPSNAFLPIYFDLHDQAARPLGQVLADLAATVAEQIGLELPDPEAFDDRGLFFSRTFLPQLHSVLGPNRRPVFLLDEFDVLDPVTEEELPAIAADRSLFRFIRRVMNKTSHPAFVFAVGRHVDDLSLDFTATFKAPMVREVWVLDWESAEAMVRQAEINQTLRFSDQAVARILSFTNGHPYLTQLLCQRVWEQAYAERPATLPWIDMPEIEAAVPDIIEASDQALAWVWDGMSLPEKIYAAGLAEIAGEREAISESQGMQVLTDHAVRLRTREVELMAPRDLVRRRVLDLTDEQEHRFAIEIFRHWVQQQKSLTDVKEELDRVDPLADELFGIGCEFFRRNQFQAAIRYFQDALAANPQHFYARLRLGETLLQLNRPDKAVIQLEKAYQQDREETRLLLTRALVAQASLREVSGDKDNALAISEQALQISPNDLAAQKIRNTILMGRLEAKARHHELTKRWGKAAAIYEQLVAQAPDLESREVWKTAFERCNKEDILTHSFQEGLGSLDKGDWKRAQMAFARVTHQQPDYVIDKQLAARLLLRAVLQKPARKFPRFTFVLFAILLVLLFGAWSIRSRQQAQPNLPVMLPDNWEHVQTYRLDANHDGDREWVVLYRFDLRIGTEESSGPIGGVVYQPDHRSSSAFTLYKLRPRNGDYLCECECTAAMEDVLSGLPGTELVVRDRCNGEITRLSIFSWEPIEGEYLPKGHFSGSQIQVETNKVTASQRLPHRAQLALQQVYQSNDSKTYYQPGDLGILVMSGEYAITFYKDEPKEPMRSPYPEKVVLAFYNHYTELRKASGYFTRDGWRGLTECTTGLCGCASPHSAISYVRVTDLHSDEDITADEITVDSHIICERQDGTSDDETFVRWYLVQQDGRWRLNDAELIIAE